ncbi:unnamed protein product [Amaranthus hypochondriacus]
MFRERECKGVLEYVAGKRKDSAAFPTFHGSRPSFRHTSVHRYNVVTRKDKPFFQTFHGNRRQLQQPRTAAGNRRAFYDDNGPISDLRAGHRGLSRLPWRRGPREPPLSCWPEKWSVHNDFC